MDRQPTEAGTIDQDEIARFSRLAGQWWDPKGPMAALHKFNPVRLAYIRDRVAEHFDRGPKRLDSLAGLRILDAYEKSLAAASFPPGSLGHLYTRTDNRAERRTAPASTLKVEAE